MSRKSRAGAGKSGNPAVLNPTASSPTAPASPSKSRHGDTIRTATRFNFRFLGILLLVAAAGAVGTKLLHDFQVRANSAQLLERAETAEKEGKRDDAVTLLNQYISLKFGGRTSLPEEEEKQHLELLVRLGQLTDPGDDPNKPAQLFRAFRIFEEALRRDGSLHDIRRRTAEIAVAFKRHRDAIDHIDVLMKDGKADTAEKVELLKLQGQCQLAMDKVLEAQLSYLDAVATDPKDVEPYVTLAMIWAEYPERAIDASKIESLKDVKYDAIRPALPVESQGPVLCALELLDIMRRTVKPAALAESHRARYLLDLRAPNEVLPQYSKAGEKANTLMGDADRNHDGKLIEAEMRHKSVPVLMDRNSDGQIEREELVRSFEEGTFKVRYETAAAAALSAWEAMRADPELGTPYERADVLMCLIDANLQLADIAKYQSSGAENAKKFRQAAREYVELGQKLPVTDSRFIVTAAELELADVARVSPKPALVLRLEACKQMIRDGLARTSAASEAETGLKSKDAQRRRQLQLGAALKLQWLLVDVLYSLASEQEGPQSTVALEEAKAEIKNLEKQSPNPLLLELLKGRELMVVGDYVGARDHIEKLRSRTEKRSEMWRRTTHLLAECHSRLENTDAVLDLFGVAAQADPALPAVLQWELGHAAAMAQLGKIDEAVQAYLRVLSRAQMPSARTQLIELMLAHLSQQPAQRRNFSVLQSGRERNQLLILPLPEKADEPWQLPEDPHLAVLMQDYAYLRAMTAQQLFELTSAPAQRDAALRYLQLASEILAAARDKFPENLRIPAAQIVLAARQFDQEPAMRVAQTQQALQQAIKDKGDAIELRLAGVQAASLFPPDVAIPMLESATKDVSGLSTDEQSALWHAVARGYAGGGNLDLAIDAWEQAVRLQPRELRPRLAILELLLADAERTNSLEQNVNSPRWQANIEPLNELEGGAAKGPYSCVFAARKHILVALRGQKGEPDAKKLKGDLNFATSLLEAAARMRPYWPTIPRALGTIALINGNADLAAKYFDEAIEKGDRSETVIGTALEHYHTQSQSLDRQERSQAQEKLTKLLELVQTQQSSLLSGNVGRIADQVLWSRSQVAEAIGINEKLRAPTADDKIRLANYELAEVDFGLIRDALTQGDRGALSLKVQERLSKAEALLKEAVAMSPEHAKAWMSLADFYSRIGELPRAEETVLAAGQRLPEKPLHLRPFTMAWCYEALSVATGVTPDKSRQLRDLARQNYQAALEASPDEPGLLFLAASFYSRDREPLQAVRLLDRVLKSGADLPEAARAQAIIAKAATKAQIGQRVALDEGITILRETKFPGKGWHARALRVQRRLLIQRNAKDDARLILESLKSLSDVDELTIEEGLEVARLHDAFGEWANARKQFESLRAKHPQDGAVLATYIHSLIRRPNEPESLKYARSLYEELERSEPTFFRTKATKCRLVAAEGRRDEAVSELLTFVKEHLIDSPKAELLEKIGVEQLETVVENLLAVAKSSQDFATLDLLTRAEQLAKSGSQEEAIAELKKIGNAQKMVAGLRIEALRQAAEVVEELGARDQAIELLREYVARSSRPGAVLDLARCLGRNGQAAEGIELCEKNWERLPISLVAVTEIALLRSIERLDRESEHVAQRLAEGVAAAKEPVAKAELLLLVADIRDFQARYDDAETAFDEVIKLIPGHVVARNNLAFLLANRKKTDRALELIQGAIASAGPAPELLDTQGVVLMMSGRFEEAVGSLSQAVATQDSSLVRLHLAEAYRLWGKPAQSKAEYEKAVALKLPVGRLHPFDRAIFDRLQTELRVAANR